MVLQNVNVNLNGVTVNNILTINSQTAIEMLVVGKTTFAVGQFVDFVVDDRTTLSVCVSENAEDINAQIRLETTGEFTNELVVTAGKFLCVTAMLETKYDDDEGYIINDDDGIKMDDFAQWLTAKANDGTDDQFNDDTDRVRTFIKALVDLNRNDKTGVVPALFSAFKAKLDEVLA